MEHIESVCVCVCVCVCVDSEDNAEIKMKRSLNSFTKGCKTLLINKM